VPRSPLPAVRAAEPHWPSCHECGGPILFAFKDPTPHDLVRLEQREARGEVLRCWACTIAWLDEAEISATGTK